MCFDGPCCCLFGGRKVKIKDVKIPTSFFGLYFAAKIPVCNFGTSVPAMSYTVDFLVLFLHTISPFPFIDANNVEMEVKIY